MGQSFDVVRVHDSCYSVAALITALVCPCAVSARGAERQSFGKHACLGVPRDLLCIVSWCSQAHDMSFYAQPEQMVFLLLVLGSVLPGVAGVR